MPEPATIEKPKKKVTETPQAEATSASGGASATIAGLQSTAGNQATSGLLSAHGGASVGDSSSVSAEADGGLTLDQRLEQLDVTALNPMKAGPRFVTTTATVYKAGKESKKRGSNTFKSTGKKARRGDVVTVIDATLYYSSWGVFKNDLRGLASVMFADGSIGLVNEAKLATELTPEAPAEDDAESTLESPLLDAAKAQLEAKKEAYLAMLKGQVPNLDMPALPSIPIPGLPLAFPGLSQEVKKSFNAPPPDGPDTKLVELALSYPIVPGVEVGGGLFVKGGAKLDLAAAAGWLPKDADDESAGNHLAAKASAEGTAAIGGGVEVFAKLNAGVGPLSVASAKAALVGDITASSKASASLDASWDPGNYMETGKIAKWGEENKPRLTVLFDAMKLTLALKAELELKLLYFFKWTYAKTLAKREKGLKSQTKTWVLGADTEMDPTKVTDQLEAGELQTNTDAREPVVALFNDKRMISYLKAYDKVYAGYGQQGLPERLPENTTKDIAKAFALLDKLLESSEAHKAMVGLQRKVNKHGQAFKYWAIANPLWFLNMLSELNKQAPEVEMSGGTT